MTSADKYLRAAAASRAERVTGSDGFRSLPGRRSVVPAEAEK